MFRNGVTVLSLLAMLASSEVVSASDDWRTELEDVCGNTSEAAVLSHMELQKLIAKGERVSKALESECEAVRIVYQKRVQKCLDLYRNIADTMQPDGKVQPPAQ
ncbi:MAG TPA: hypothetical protein HPP97_11280 [Desulfuromonadales bacterium]|nr:hypothetical protein [Desulfuromonadales bacterium]